MLRFHLFGFPVSIHWMFWLTAALLSGQIDNLSRPGALWIMGIWMAVVFLSVLWHELGHVIFQRKFGARPEIMLVAFGGLAIPHGARFTRGQSFIVAAAGPVFGLLLWAASEVLFHLRPPASPMERQLSGMILVVNLFWSLVNLLPVLPLDGGHMMLAALGPRRQRLAAGIGMVVSALIAVAAFRFLGSFFMAFFFRLVRLAELSGFQAGAWVGGPVNTVPFRGAAAPPGFSAPRHIQRPMAAAKDAVAGAARLRHSRRLHEHPIPR